MKTRDTNAATQWLPTQGPKRFPGRSPFRFGGRRAQRDVTAWVPDLVLALAVIATAVLAS